MKSNALGRDQRLAFGWTNNLILTTSNNWYTKKWKTKQQKQQQQN